MKIRLPLSLRSALLACMAASIFQTVGAATLSWYPEYLQNNPGASFEQFWWNTVTGQEQPALSGDSLKFADTNPATAASRTGLQTVDFGTTITSFGDFTLNSALNWTIDTKGASFQLVTINSTSGSHLTLKNGIIAQNGMSISGGLISQGNVNVTGNFTLASGTFTGTNLTLGGGLYTNAGIINLSGVLTTDSWALGIGSITANDVTGTNQDMALSGTNLTLTKVGASTLTSLNLSSGAQLHLASLTSTGAITIASGTVLYATGAISGTDMNISGLINAQSLTQTGTLTTAATANITLTGNLQTASSSLGAGTISARTWAGADTNFSLNATKLTLTGTTALNWTGLSLSGAATLNAASALNISGSTSIGAGSILTSTGSLVLNNLIISDTGKITNTAPTINGYIQTDSWTFITGMFVNNTVTASDWVSTATASPAVLNAGVKLTLTKTGTKSLDSLNLNSGATLTMSAGALAIAGNLNMAGGNTLSATALTLASYSGSGSNTITTTSGGNLTFTGTGSSTLGSLTMNVGGLLTMGNWNLTGGTITAASLASSGNALVINGTKITVSTKNDTTWDSMNLTNSAQFTASGTGTGSGTGSIVVTNNVTLDNGSTTLLKSTNGSITVGGILTNGKSVTATLGTIQANSLVNNGTGVLSGKQVNITTTAENKAGGSITASNTLTVGGLLTNLGTITTTGTANSVSTTLQNVDNSGSITTTTGNLLVTGTTINRAGGTISAQNMALNGVVTNLGTLSTTAAAGTLTIGTSPADTNTLLTNSGIINSKGALTVNGAMGNTGTMTSLDIINVTNNLSQTSASATITATKDLTVGGTLTSSGKIYGANMILKGAVNNSGTLSATGATGAITIGTSAADTNTLLTNSGIINTNGVLTVNGAMINTGTITSLNTINVTNNLSQTGTSAAITAATGLTVGGNVSSAGSIKATTGNIGITGTANLTSTSALLQALAGNLSVGSNLTSQGTVFAKTGMTIGGDLSSSGSTTTDTGNISITGGASLTSATALLSALNGNVSIGGNLVSSGTVSAIGETGTTSAPNLGNISIGGNATLNAGSSLLAEKGTLTILGALTTNGTAGSRVTITAENLLTNASAGAGTNDLNLNYTDLTLTLMPVPESQNLFTTTGNATLTGSTFSVHGMKIGGNVSLVDGSSLISTKLNYVYSGSDTNGRTHSTGVDMEIDGLLTSSGTGNSLVSYGNMLVGNNNTLAHNVTGLTLDAWGTLDIKGSMTVGANAAITGAGITISQGLTVNAGGSLMSKQADLSGLSLLPGYTPPLLDLTASPADASALTIANNLTTSGIITVAGALTVGNTSDSDMSLTNTGFVNALAGSSLTAGNSRIGGDANVKALTLTGANVSFTENMGLTVRGSTTNGSGAYALNLTGTATGTQKVIVGRSIDVLKSDVFVGGNSTLSAGINITVGSNNASGGRHDLNITGGHSSVSAGTQLTVHGNLNILGDSNSVSAYNIYITYDNSPTLMLGTVTVNGNNNTITAGEQFRAYALVLGNTGKTNNRINVGNSGAVIDTTTQITSGNSIASSGTILFNGMVTNTGGAIQSGQIINFQGGLAMNGGTLTAGDQITFATGDSVNNAGITAKTLNISGTTTNISNSWFTVANGINITGGTTNISNVIPKNGTTPSTLGLISIAGDNSPILPTTLSITGSIANNHAGVLYATGMEITNATVTLGDITGLIPLYIDLTGDRKGTATVNTNGVLTINKGSTWGGNVELKDQSILNLLGGTIAGNLIASGTIPNNILDPYHIVINVAGGLVKGDVILDGINLTGTSLIPGLGATGVVTVDGAVIITNYKGTIGGLPIPEIPRYFASDTTVYNNGTNAIVLGNATSNLSIIEGNSTIQLGKLVPNIEGGSMKDVSIRYGSLTVVTGTANGTITGDIYFDASRTEGSNNDINRILSFNTNATIAGDMIVLANGVLHVTDFKTLTLNGELRGDRELLMEGGGTKVFNHILAGTTNPSSDYTADIKWTAGDIVIGADNALGTKGTVNVQSTTGKKLTLISRIGGTTATAGLITTSKSFDFTANQGMTIQTDSNLQITGDMTGGDLLKTGGANLDLSKSNVSVSSLTISGGSVTDLNVPPRTDLYQAVIANSGYFNGQQGTYKNLTANSWVDPLGISGASHGAINVTNGVLFGAVTTSYSMNPNYDASGVVTMTDMRTDDRRGTSINNEGSLAITGSNLSMSGALTSNMNGGGKVSISNSTLFMDGNVTVNATPVDEITGLPEASGGWFTMNQSVLTTKGSMSIAGITNGIQKNNANLNTVNPATIPFVGNQLSSNKGMNIDLEFTGSTAEGNIFHSDTQAYAPDAPAYGTLNFIGKGEFAFDNNILLAKKGEIVALDFVDGVTGNEFTTETANISLDNTRHANSDFSDNVLTAKTGIALNLHTDTDGLLTDSGQISGNRLTDQSGGITLSGDTNGVDFVHNSMVTGGNLNITMLFTNPDVSKHSVFANNILTSGYGVTNGTGNITLTTDILCDATSITDWADDNLLHANKGNQITAGNILTNQGQLYLDDDSFITARQWYVNANAKVRNGEVTITAPINAKTVLANNTIHLMLDGGQGHRLAELTTNGGTLTVRGGAIVSTDIIKGTNAANTAGNFEIFEGSTLSAKEMLEAKSVRMTGDQNGTTSLFNVALRDTTVNELLMNNSVFTSSNGTVNANNVYMIGGSQLVSQQNSLNLGTILTTSAVPGFTGSTFNGAFLAKRNITFTLGGTMAIADIEAGGSVVNQRALVLGAGSTLIAQTWNVAGTEGSAGSPAISSVTQGTVSVNALTINNNNTLALSGNGSYNLGNVLMNGSNATLNLNSVSPQTVNAGTVSGGILTMTNSALNAISLNISTQSTISGGIISTSGDVTFSGNTSLLNTQLNTGSIGNIVFNQAGSTITNLQGSTLTALGKDIRFGAAVGGTISGNSFNATNLIWNSATADATLGINNSFAIQNTTIKDNHTLRLTGTGGSASGLTNYGQLGVLTAEGVANFYLTNGTLQTTGISFGRGQLVLGGTSTLNSTADITGAGSTISVGAGSLLSTAGSIHLNGAGSLNISGTAGNNARLNAAQIFLSDSVQWTLSNATSTASYSLSNNTKGSISASTVTGNILNNSTGLLSLGNGTRVTGNVTLGAGSLTQATGTVTVDPAYALLVNGGQLNVGYDQNTAATVAATLHANVVLGSGVLSLMDVVSVDAITMQNTEGSRELILSNLFTSPYANINVNTLNMSAAATVTINAGRTLTIGNATAGNILTGSQTMTLRGSGTLALNGANSNYSGDIQWQGSGIQLGANNAMGPSGTLYVTGDRSLNLAATTAQAKNISVNNISDSLTLSNNTGIQTAMTGRFLMVGDLIKTGSGTVVLNNNTSKFNNVIGTAGTLTLMGVQSLSGELQATSGTIILNGYSATQGATNHLSITNAAGQIQLINGSLLNSALSTTFTVGTLNINTGSTMNVTGDVAFQSGAQLLMNSGTLTSTGKIVLGPLTGGNTFALSNANLSANGALQIKSALTMTGTNSLTANVLNVDATTLLNNTSVNVGSTQVNQSFSLVGSPAAQNSFGQISLLSNNAIFSLAGLSAGNRLAASGNITSSHVASSTINLTHATFNGDMRLYNDAIYLTDSTVAGNVNFVSTATGTDPTQYPSLWVSGNNNAITELALSGKVYLRSVDTNEAWLTVNNTEVLEDTDFTISRLVHLTSDVHVQGGSLTLNGHLDADATKNIKGNLLCRLSIDFLCF